MLDFYCSHAFCASQLILAINLHYPGSTQHFKRRSGLINIFKESLFTRCFQLCLSPACSSSPLPPKIPVCCMCPRLQYLLLFFLTHSVFSLCSCRCRNDIYRGTLFRPLQFFCKVRYVNWPVLPRAQSSCMCCMCAANIIMHSNPNLRMKNCCLLSTSQNRLDNVGFGTQTHS